MKKMGILVMVCNANFAWDLHGIYLYPHFGRFWSRISGWGYNGRFRCCKHIFFIDNLTKKDAFMIPSTTDVQPMTYIPNPPMGQMNPLMMFALMKDGSSRSSDLALMMMMMGGQGK